MGSFYNRVMCIRDVRMDSVIKRREYDMKKYENKDKKCECFQCEWKETCPYKDKYQRLPRTNPGALGLCKKL